MNLYKIIFLIVAPIFIYWNSFGQINFQNTYSVSDHHEGRSIQLTNDGGYIIAGFHEAFGGDPPHIYLIKIGINGDTLWTKLFLDFGSEANSIIQTYDSGYALAGGPLFLVMKTDVNGDTVWSKSYGDGFAFDIQQTYEGGYIVIGNKQDSIGSNIYLVKTDFNGDTLWTREYGFGSSANCLGKSIRQTPDSGYIFTGNTGAGGKLFLVKTDKYGDTLWTKAYGRGLEDAGNAVRHTKDNGYIVAGYTSSGSLNNDIYLIKTDLFGDTLWSKVIGGTQDDVANDIQNTIDSGYIIAGSYSKNGVDDLFLVKINSSGDTLWTRSYGGSYNDWSNSVKETNDSGFILVGGTESFGTVISSIYLVKTDAFGNSGCNLKSSSTNINNSGTLVSHFPFLISSGGMVSSTSLFNFRIFSGCTANTLCSSISVNELEKEEFITLYPNPSSGKFIVGVNRKFNTETIIVFNILGEKLLEEQLNNSKQEINLENISSGIYFISISDGEKLFSRKIIIE